jgi:hypothetical protein
LRGIYGTNGSCVDKLLFKESCDSHKSCKYSSGLICSDNGCVCEQDDKYWSPVEQNCVDAVDLCDSSDLVCGSCIKEFTSTESFTNAEANCVNLTEFQHLHIIRNKAQWFYDINKTMNEPHWVKHNLKRNNFYYISF